MAKALLHAEREGAAVARRSGLNDTRRSNVSLYPHRPISTFLLAIPAAPCIAAYLRVEPASPDLSCEGCRDSPGVAVKI